MSQPPATRRRADRSMRGAAALALAAGMTLVGMPHELRAVVSACPNAANCVQVIVTNAPTTAKPGDAVTVLLTFKQAPDDGKSGGPDEIGALAMTLGMPGSSAGGTPLILADAPNCQFSCLGGDNNGQPCTMNPLDCPGGQCHGPSVEPDPVLLERKLRLVIENATCRDGRTHCLCPDAGQVQDNFINLVIFGPNPLPTPGPTPVEIPTLPGGPQTVATLNLKVPAVPPTGPVPLHVFNQVQDAAAHPQFVTLLSVGDRLAVDQTCVPVAGTAPCSGQTATSQVATTDGFGVEVSGATCQAGETTCAPCKCVDDCDDSHDVFGNEVTKAVNIVSGAADLVTCPAADANCSGDVFGNEVTIGVNNVANGCPGAQ